MKQVLIITGGYLNIEFAKSYLKTLSYDKVFAVDKGLEYAMTLGIIPDYLIGDFDTVDEGLFLQYERKIKNSEIRTCMERHPAKKAATDTELALVKAMQIGADSIILLAGTGCRMDHVLANIGLLVKAAKQGICMYIVDETNRIRIMTQSFMPQCVITKEEQYGKYVSLIPISSKVEGVTLNGALYPLEDAEITQGSSLTISNEIEDSQLEITIQTGSILVIESRDEMASIFL